jgi:mannosyltransferase
MPNLYLDLRIFGMQPFGGISTQWADLLKRIDPHLDDFTVTLLLPKISSNILFQSLPLDRFDVREVRAKGSYTKYAPNLLRGNRDDILHPSYYAQYPRFKGKRVITVHDFNYDFHKNPFIRNAHRWLMADSIRQADVILCVSETTKRALLTAYQGLVSNRVYVTPNATDLHYDSASRPQNYFIWVGERDGTKRFRDALRFMRVLAGNPGNETKLVVTGRPLNEHEKAEISDLGLADRIESRPYASQSELSELYGNAIALLYLSEFEGFGIPIIEAQACGCPVVARPSETSVEVGRDSLVYIENFTPGHVVGVWDQLTHSDSRNMVISSGRKNCARYNWDDTVNTIMQAYRSVVDKA